MLEPQVHFECICFQSFPVLYIRPLIYNHFLKGLSQIVPGARTASKKYYLSHIILLIVRAPGLICESPLSHINTYCYIEIFVKITNNRKIDIIAFTNIIFVNKYLCEFEDVLLSINYFQSAILKKGKQPILLTNVKKLN